MKFNVKVIPNAKRNDVSMEGEKLKIRVTAPAVDNKANKAVIEVLSEFFKMKKRDIKIISGEKNREKVIEIECS
jgi:uncharacterized protein (TIGR00251 family)